MATKVKGKKAQEAQAAKAGENDQATAAAQDDAQKNAAADAHDQGQSDAPGVPTVDELFPLVVDGEEFGAADILAYRLIEDGYVRFVTSDGRKLDAPLPAGK